ERTRLLLHVLDLDPGPGRDPVDDLRVINGELAAYSAELAARPQLIVLNKIDLAGAMPETAERRQRVEQHCARTGVPLFCVSAVTGAGLPELVGAIAARLEDAGWMRAAS
ncbi:MAG: GTPase ObgE, partial [Candidatus Rokuibacteriota bacterium]